MDVIPIWVQAAEAGTIYVNGYFIFVLKGLDWIIFVGIIEEYYAKIVNT